MNVNLDKNTIAIIIFVVAAALLSTAQTVVTTGVVGIMGDFHVTNTLAQWVYSSFLLVLGVMIPLSAYIARRFKVRTTINVSLVIFLIGCILAYIAPNIYVLILGRIVQGIGGGILLPITQIVLLKIVPKEKWQVYMGLFGFIIGVVPALAPTVGGFMVDTLGWRSIFLFFAIAAIAVLAIAYLGIKIEFETGDYPLDFISLILAVLSCMGILLGLTNFADYGTHMSFTIAPIVIGLVSLILFVYRQFHIESPLLDLRILIDKYYFFGTLFSSILYFTMCGLYVLMPLFVQSVCHESATTAGIVLLPATLLMIVFNFVGPLLAQKFGVRKVLIVSCIFSIAGFYIMTTYNANTSMEYMIVTQIIRSIGAGLGLMPVVTWTLSVAKGNIEDATAINNTVRQIIGASGSAVAATLLAVFTGGYVAHNKITTAAFSKTSLFMAALCVVALIIVIVYIKDGVETGSDKEESASVADDDSSAEGESVSDVDVSSSAEGESVSDVDVSSSAEEENIPNDEENSSDVEEDISDEE